MLNYIIIFLISMVPLVELRGALIYSQAIGMPLLASYIICVIGNMLPVPIIYLFARKVLIWGKDKKHIGKFFTFCIEKGEKGGKKLQETAGKGLFVAASFLDMDFKSSVIAVMGGVLLAGIIMGLGSAGVFGALTALF